MTSNVPDDFDIGLWSETQVTKAETSRRVRWDIAIDDRIQTKPALVLSETMASLAHLVLTLPQPARHPRAVVIGVFLGRMIGFGRVVPFLEDSPVRNVALRHYHTQLSGSVGVKLLLCDLLEEAIFLVSIVGSELAQTHLFAKDKTQRIERILLLLERPLDVPTRNTYPKAFLLGIDNERITVHDASVDPAKMAAPPAVLAFEAALVQARHGGVVAFGLPSADWLRVRRHRHQRFSWEPFEGRKCRGWNWEWTVWRILNLLGAGGIVCRLRDMRQPTILRAVCVRRTHDGLSKMVANRQVLLRPSSGTRGRQMPKAGISLGAAAGRERFLTKVEKGDTMRFSCGRRI
jgi:hypothetical protein